MSKSYKYPIFKDRNPYNKKIANRTVRQRLKKFISFSKGNWYKKIFNQYNICDYKIEPSTEEQKIKASRK